MTLILDDNGEVVCDCAYIDPNLLISWLKARKWPLLTWTARADHVAGGRSPGSVLRALLCEAAFRWNEDPSAVPFHMSRWEIAECTLLSERSITRPMNRLRERQLIHDTKMASEDGFQGKAHYWPCTARIWGAAAQLTDSCLADADVSRLMGLEGCLRARDATRLVKGHWLPRWSELEPPVITAEVIEVSFHV